MKKLLLASLCFLLLCITHAFAQNRTITGTVTAKEDGQPIPGVTVKIKNTNFGVATDVNGKYSISAPIGSTLTFSYIAYLTQEIPLGDNSVINVSLAENNKELTEVVVTALGIGQEKRTLGYSQATVGGDVMTKSSPINLLTGVQGKVAGVTISETGSTPGGTTEVIIRGYSSMSQSNQPLYVIDGVPLNNSRPNQFTNIPANDNAYDFGNNANDVDNNDVENISILKGAEATALYGTRGSSGVILITTKKGKAGKPVVNFSSTTTMTSPAITFTPQSEFGQGWYNTFILTENGDWGPKYDGVLRPWGATGATLGNTQLLKPFSFIKDNVANAFDTGLELDNHVDISGGTDDTRYLFSYTNVYSNGILPGPYDLFKKNNFSVNASTKYKNLEVSGSLNYTARTSSVPLTGEGNNTTQGNSFYGSLLQTPSDIPIKDLRDYNNLYFNTDNYFTPYAENPYFDLAQNGSDYTTNHIFGNLNVTYKLTDWVKLNFQQSADVASTSDKKWSNISIPTTGSWDAGVNVESAPRANDVGSDFEESSGSFEYDSKLQALFDKKISNDFHITGVLGSNYNDRGSRAAQTEVTGLAIPGFYQINNSLNPPQSLETDSHRRLLAFYGQATLGYKDYLYLGLTGRNDITSTLAPGNNSYFYPAASLSFILTDALGMKSDILNYAKLRAAYGRTGSDTDPYRTTNTLTSTNVPLGFGNTTFPISGVAGYSVNNTLYSTNLKPEAISETEIGGEFRFLNDRLSVDATWYNRIRKDQIVSIPIAPSSGYEYEVENFGTTRNRGFELTLGGTPIQTNDVTWHMTYTYSMDRSTVLALPSGANQLLYSFRDVNMEAIVGQPLGVLQAPTVETENGHIVVGATGLPVEATTFKNYGSIEPQFHMGFTNDIKVKDFDLGFTIDYQQGGTFYSETSQLLTFIGANPQTT
jgi:TonB-linked SusC/RagA family outer membrane protein